MLACQDRLFRVLKDSACHFEVEVCGIPTVVQIVPKHLMPEGKQTKSGKSDEVCLCYGTMDGKIALVTFRFVDKNQLEPVHNWEVPLDAIKQPITCIAFSDTEPLFFVGRADGAIEVRYIALLNL